MAWFDTIKEIAPQKISVISVATTSTENLFYILYENKAPSSAKPDGDKRW